MNNTKTIYVPNRGKIELHYGLLTLQRPNEGVKRVSLEGLKNGCWKDLRNNLGYYLNDKGNKYLVIYDLTTKCFAFVTTKQRDKVIYIKFDSSRPAIEFYGRVVEIV